MIPISQKNAQRLACFLADILDASRSVKRYSLDKKANLADAVLDLADSIEDALIEAKFLLNCGARDYCPVMAEIINIMSLHKMPPEVARQYLTKRKAA